MKIHVTPKDEPKVLRASELETGKVYRRVGTGSFYGTVLCTADLHTGSKRVVDLSDGKFVKVESPDMNIYRFVEVEATLNIKE